MSPNPVRQINAIFSRGGDELIHATLRRGRAADAQAMYELSLPFIASGNLIVRERELFERAAEEFYVVEIDRTVVACAGVRGFTEMAELFNVAVHHRWQGLGLGRFLLAGMVCLLREQDFAHVLVFTQSTLGWFVRHGFTPVDTALLPPERLALIDPGRGSVPLLRSTVGGADVLESLAELTEVQVEFARTGQTHRWEGKFDSLLQFTEHHGIEVDSLCWGGVCGTCAVRLTHGTVNYQVAPEIDPEEGEVLLCISLPLTHVVLDL
jgi:N-acetylglutamate synthase-like GNAT family acetyltransferase/ferredoxin